MNKSLCTAAFLSVLSIVLLAGEACFSEEPPLPSGLGSSAADSEPELPSGLGSDEPDLPSGLGDEFDDFEDFADDRPEPQRKSKLPDSLDHNGFIELRAGTRTQKDEYQDLASIGEVRIQNQLEWSERKYGARLTADVIADPVADEYDVRLEDGRGALDLREAYLLFRPSSVLDVKAGRQILTWGVGDMVFLNDLFPKDWNSFFIGRDTEYLKAPSDAIRASIFSKAVNLELVYTPRFDADRYIDGRRISYFNAQLGRLAGEDAVVDAERPDEWFEDHEFSTRLYRNVGGAELAAYFYHGFWKSPNGFNPASGRAVFPDLNAWGLSARKPAAGGIAAFEFSYYDTRSDRRGTDPFIRNGELRFLGSLERELARNLTGAVQYYVEHMLDHDEHRQSLPPDSYVKNESRQLLTLRLTKLAMNQNLTLSLFAFLSPTDEDAYLRPKLSYSIDDHWTVDGGGNVFIGNRQATFFGQFEYNSNVYAGLRYSY